MCVCVCVCVCVCGGGAAHSEITPQCTSRKYVCVCVLFLL